MISERCPAWCVAEHGEPGDEHRSASSTVAAVIIETGVPQAVELVIDLHRAHDDPTIWCYIGEGRHQYLELSAESAWRLVHELIAALSVVDSRSQ